MSDSVTIQSQAEIFSETRLSDNVYALLCQPEPHVEVVFFHGLQGPGSDAKHAFWRTWKMRHNEECWPEKLLPQLLKTDKGIQYRARVLSTTYESRLAPGKDGNGTESSDEYIIVECLYQELILGANVGQTDGVPVFLVGHDLGGILIKKLVMMVENRAANTSDDTEKAKLCNFLKNLKSVFFYATPHYGSVAFQKMSAKLDRKDANQMLRLMTVLHKETARINTEFQTYRHGNADSQRSRFSTYGIHASWVTNEGGFNVQVVPEGSARIDMDNFYSASADHFTICQPQDQSTTEVLMLGRAIIMAIETIQKEASRPRSQGRTCRIGGPRGNHRDNMARPYGLQQSNGEGRNRRS